MNRYEMLWISGMVLCCGLAATIVVHRITDSVSYHEWVDTRPRHMEQNLEGVEMRWGTLMLKEPLLRTEVATAVKDPEWQVFRESLHYLPLPKRYIELESWLWKQERSRKSFIQVTNYINALKRAGMIKED